jgi:hypothetical protein
MVKETAPQIRLRGEQMQTPSALTYLFKNE